MASGICGTRSYADFITACKKYLPAFFQFEGVGILFKDQKENQMFTINQHFEDDEVALMKRMEKKKQQGIAWTREEIHLDFKRQLKRQGK